MSVLELAALIAAAWIVLTLGFGALWWALVELSEALEARRMRRERRRPGRKGEAR